MPQAVALGPEGNPQFTCFEMTAKPSQNQHYSDSKLKKVEAPGLMVERPSTRLMTSAWDSTATVRATLRPFLACFSSRSTSFFKPALLPASCFPRHFLLPSCPKPGQDLHLDSSWLTWPLDPIGKQKRELLQVVHVPPATCTGLSSVLRSVLEGVCSP